MTTKRDIKHCNDIELLRILALNQDFQLAIISEVLVDESKMHITAEQAVEEIRNYLNKYQYDLDLEWIKMRLDAGEEALTIKNIKVEG